MKAPTDRRMTVIVACAWLAFAAIAAFTHWIGSPMNNLTPSVPRGWYFMWREPHAIARLKRDDSVTFCAPIEAVVQDSRMKPGAIPRVKGSCADGYVPFIKRAAALPGDTVRIVPGPRGRMEINGRRRNASAQIDTDRSGRPLPRMAGGTYMVRTGTIWVLGTDPHSWDSRYWGPVPTTNLNGRGFPIWTKRP